MGDRMNNMGKMMSNPKQRNMYLLGTGVIILTLGAGFYVATKNSADKVQSGSQLESVPGSVNAVPGSSRNPDYIQSVNAVNDRDAASAIQQGNSYVPTITAPNLNNLASLDEIARRQKEESEEKFRKEAERKKAEEEERLVMEEEANKQQAFIEAQKPVVQEVYVPPAPVMQAPPMPAARLKYSDDDYLLIASLNSSWQNKNPSTEFDFARGTAPREATSSNGSNYNQGGSNMSNGNSNNSGSGLAMPPVAKSGDIFNAVIETAVNSDEQSPVLARIVSGKLKGTRLIGTFQNLGQKVAIVFTKANIPGLEKSIPINAYAVDTNTSRTALADEVNNHYFLRYGVLLATSFVSGYSKALADSGSSVVSNMTGTTTTKPTYTPGELTKVAVGEVGTQISNDVKQQFNNLKPTIYVNSGSAIGILLMDDLSIK